MILLEIVILAVLQGITEFLPVSSSGHLVVLADLFDQFGHPMEKRLTVNVVLHLGTLGAILVFYRERILRLLGEDRRVIGLLAVGTIPAAAVGLLLWWFGNVLESALLAGFMFPLTGAVLLWTARDRSTTVTCLQLGYGRALLIGTFQAFAIFPGISRSGATIAAGLGSGLRREDAAAFSFLLAIPAIGGAGLLEVLSLLKEPPEDTHLGVLAVGAFVSFAVGVGSLAWLVRWLKQGRLHRFAWWVLPLGPVVVAWQLLWR